MNSPAKGLKNMVTKVQWLCWRIQDNWSAYFKIWSRQTLGRFCGRARTYWSQSDAFDSRKPVVMLIVNRTPSHVTFFRVSQHTFQCRTWHWLKVSCAHHAMSSCVWLCVWSDTLQLHLALFAVSLIFLFSWSSSSFSVWVGSGRSPHAYFREWGVRRFMRQQSSHRWGAQRHRQLPHLREATAGPRTWHVWEISDYTIGRAHSSPLFTQWARRFSEP